MVDIRQFNSLPLLSAKPGLDNSLKIVSRELEAYFAEGLAGAAHLRDALAELHRATGVLRILSLDGVAVFCKEFETVITEITQQSQDPSSMQREVVLGALQALTHYLDALANGAPNAALRLFYTYQELQQLRGVESAFEVDLFFPDLDVSLPAAILDIPLSDAAAVQIKSSRAQYQQSLLKWLRQDNPVESLRAMRSAVQEVMSCVPPSQERAFWWIASGLLDCLILDGLPPELSAKKLLGRIDLQMKSLADNGHADEYATTCEMLYMIGRSHSVSDTVEEIKQHYALASYLPEEPPLPPGEVELVLDQMRHHLNQAQEILERCAKGDVATSQNLVEQLERLYALSEQLDHNTLQFLCKQLYSAIALPDDPEAVHNVKTEISIGLILLGNGIEHYLSLGNNFHEQARIVSQMLQVNSALTATDESSMDSLIALYCQADVQEVLMPLAGEIKANMQHVEQTLSSFFSDNSKRGELVALRQKLNQVHGALYMLALELPAQLLAALQQIVGRYAAGDNPSSTEMRDVAAAVSALDAYIHDLTQGQKSNTGAFEELIAALHVDHPQTETVEQQAVATPAGVSVREGGEDDELLEVFLEEAHEVLETLHANVLECETNANNREALITIRRGFHTLKGSGRMVGLTNLGEVAWALERAMNKWLQDEKPASPALLEMIGDAEVLFQHWVDKLLSGGSALIDTVALLAAAQRIESGIEEPAAPVESVATAQPIVEEAAGDELESMALTESEPETELEAQGIVIGEVTVSPVLFKIATEEAATNVEALQRQAAALRETVSPVVTYDSMRAAHTLAGINRTMGIRQIAELASAFELWLQTYLDGQMVLEQEQLELLDTTISSLDEMNQTLRSKQAPQAQPELIARLHESRPKLQEAPTENLLALPFENLTLESGIQEVVAAEGMREETVEWTPEPLQLDSLEELGQQPTLQAEDLELPAIQAEETPGLEFEALITDFGGQEDAAPTLAETQVAGHENKITGNEEYTEKPSLALDVSLSPADSGISETTTPQQAIPGHKPEQSDQAAQSEEQIVDDSDINLVSYAEYMAQQQAAVGLLPSTPVIEIESQLEAPESNVTEAEQLQRLIAAAHEEEALARAQQIEKMRTVHDDLDEQLLPIFLEEADELYPQISNEMRSWRELPEDSSEGQKYARNLQRSLHTLKGSARMAGAMRLGELTHRVEDCLDRVVAKGRQDEATMDELDNYFDRIANALEQLRRGEAMEEFTPEAPATETLSKPAQQKSETTTPDSAQMQPIQKVAQHLAAQPEQQPEDTEERAATAMLRVRSDIVDDLVNEAGEISVARSRIEIELRAFKDGLLELTDSVSNLRKLVKEIEIHAEGQMQARVTIAGDSAEKFDPLEFDRFTRFQELTRFMNESVHDVQTVQQTLLKNMDETASAMSAQAHMNRELQQGLMSIRMLPLSSISQRLYRVVRQTGKELNKKVNLELRGAEMELDRSVLEKMTAPFEHLLRNSIVHGLEDASQREAQGKSPVGNITLSSRQEGNEVVFELTDDGAGLNLVKLRQKGLENGLIQQGATVSDEQVMQLIFATGLSTASELTEISGRGVGMDVVRSEITGLGGRVEVHSESGKGTRFVIYLPLTLAVMKSLTVRAVQQMYAIPSVMVEQVQQIKPAALEALYREGKVEWQDKTYPLHYLPSLLGDYEHMPEIKPYNAVLLLRSGEQRMALHLDELLGNQEVVVKNIGPQLARLPGIAGATVMGDGKVVLILNPLPLLQQVEGVRHEVSAAPVVEPVHKTPVVMVVDDSLTVRKITTRLLTRAGYQVVTAKDGVDALEQLVEMTPDLMLLDVEMPRMDGFELTKQLRRDIKTLHMPIIMITSRTADKHKNFALELGVDEYMGKPYNEEELLENITRLITSHEMVEPQPA